MEIHNCSTIGSQKCSSRDDLWRFIVVPLLDLQIGLGGLGVTRSPRDPRFAGSNPTEIDKYFSGRKNPEHKSSGRDFKLGSRV